MHQVLTTLNPAQVEHRQHIQPEFGAQSLTYSSSTDPPVLIQGDKKTPLPQDRIRAAAFFYTDTLDQEAPYQRLGLLTVRVLPRKHPHPILTSPRHTLNCTICVPLSQSVSFKTNRLDRSVTAPPAPTQDQRGRINLAPQPQHTVQLLRTHSPLRLQQLLSQLRPSKTSATYSTGARHAVTYPLVTIGPSFRTQRQKTSPHKSVISSQLHPSSRTN